MLVDSGERLIDAIDSGQMKIVAAFWARKSDGGKWYLHLASPFVDIHGSFEAYGIVNDVLGKTPDLWIDPFDIKVLRTDDSLTEAVLVQLKTRVRSSKFTGQNPVPYPGMTVLYDCTLAGYEFDEVMIYPPRQPQASP